MNWYVMSQQAKTTYQFYTEQVREGGVDLIEYHCLMSFTGVASKQNRYESAVSAFENFRKNIWRTFESKISASGVLLHDSENKTAKQLFGVLLKRDGIQVLRENDENLYARFIIRITPLNESDLPIGERAMKDALSVLGFQEI